MGAPPHFCRGPIGQGTDIRPGSWDTAMLEVVRTPKLGLTIPRLVFYGKVNDDEHVEDLAVFYRVQSHASDSAPDQTLADRLQGRLEKRGIRSYRCRYNTSPSDIKITENKAEKLLTLERTMVLDDVHWAFMGGLGIILPQNFEEICGGAFWRELSNPTRVPTRWHGREYNAWRDSDHDHAMHAISYALVALHMGGLLRSGGEATMGATRGLVSSSDSLAKILDPGIEENDDDAYAGATWSA